MRNPDSKDHAREGEQHHHNHHRDEHRAGRPAAQQHGFRERRGAQALLFLLVLLAAVPALPARTPCAIVVKPGAAPLEQLAGAEVQRYFRQIFGFEAPVAVSPPGDAENLIVVRQDARRLGEQEYTIESSPRSIRIAGGSPLATLWAAYELLESYGVRYLLSGDVLPSKGSAFHLAEVHVRRTPEFALRCWRIWNIHAFGPESWGIAEQTRVIDQLVKLRFNAVLVFLWPFQPFVDYQYGGVRKTSGDLFFGWKYPLGPDTIGLEKFGGAAEFANPDFRNAHTYEERLAAGKKLMHGTLAYAHSRGLKTILSFALIDFPQEFKDRFKDWLPGANRPTAEDKIDYIYQGLYSFGTDRAGAAFLDVDNPRLLELVETVVRAYIDTYPEADFYALGTVEFRSAVAGYGRIWETLDRKYGLERTTPLAELLDRARHRGGGWDPKRAEREVEGDIEFLYFLDKLVNERQILAKTKRPDAKLIVSHLAQELHPVLPSILPPNSGYLANLDYTLSRSVEHVGSLRRFGDLLSMLILTLHDDNIGMLLQMPGRSCERMLQAMRQNGISGYMVRYWMSGDLDLSAEFLASASWIHDLPFAQAYRDLLTKLCGKRSAEEAMTAFLQLEDATAWTETQGNLLGYGFPVPDNLVRHFEAGTPNPPSVAEAVARYSEALPGLERARDTALPDGRRFLDHYIGRLRTTIGYLRLTGAVRQLGISYAAWKKLKHDGMVRESVTAAGEVRGRALDAEAQSRRVVESFAAIARDRSDLGMLAIMNRYIYQYVKGLNLKLELETDLWRVH